MSNQPEEASLDKNRLSSVIAPEAMDYATQGPIANPLEHMTPEQKSAIAMFIKTPAKLGLVELIIGFAVLFAWITAFAAGTVVATQPYRDLFGQKEAIDFWMAVKAWAIIIPCYTVTNLAVLSCLAGFLGGVANRSGVDGDGEDSERRSPVPHDGLTGYVAATIRGFFMYLTILSGLLLLATEAVSNPSQSQYVRLAGTMSVLCFITGYDSAIFSKILRRVADFAEGQPGGKPTTEPR